MTTTAHQVLLVDDNDLNRTLVRSVLARSDHPVVQTCALVEAEDLASARRQLAQTAFALLLLDMQLPDGHGLDLAREIIGEHHAHRPVIIALTASVMPDAQAAIREAGCDEFLGKPFRGEDLIALLASHLS